MAVAEPGGRTGPATTCTAADGTIGETTEVTTCTMELDVLRTVVVVVVVVTVVVVVVGITGNPAPADLETRKCTINNTIGR